MWKQITNLKPEHQLLLGIAIIVILSSLFWRSINNTPLTIGAEAYLGNLRGKVQLEAFDGEYNGDHDDNYIYRKKHFVLFYVPWCGYCKNILPIWDQLSQKYGQNGNVDIMKVNCEKFTNMATKHGVDSYPTIKFFPNGIQDHENYIHYVDSRDLSSFSRFLEEHSTGRTSSKNPPVEQFKNKNRLNTNEKGYNAPIGYNDFELFEPFSMENNDNDENSDENENDKPDDWYLKHMAGGVPQTRVNGGPIRLQ
jgi:thiol-disulfide isomerase/thioredoxin